MKHADDDPVMFGYDSSRNITFNNQDDPDESGYTWGQWRQMSTKERDAVIEDYLWDLVDVYVVDDEM